MLLTLQILGIFDNLKGKGSIKHYQKKLQEYQEQEADTLIDMGVLLLEEEEYNESLESFKEAREIYHKLDYKEGEAFVLDLIGDAHLGMREIDAALENYKNSFKLYSEIRSPIKNEMFEKIREVEDIKEAIKIAMEEEKIENRGEVYDDEEQGYIIDYEKISDKLEKVIEMLEEHHMYESYSKEEDKMAYLKEAMDAARGIGDKTREITILLMIGNTLLKEGNVQESIKYFKEACKIAHKIGDKRNEAFSELLIGTALFISDDGEKNLDEVYDVFKEAVETFEELGDKYGESVALDLIDTLYQEAQKK